MLKTLLGRFKEKVNLFLTILNFNRSMDKLAYFSAFNILTGFELTLIEN